MSDYAEIYIFIIIIILRYETALVALEAVLVTDAATNETLKMIIQLAVCANQYNHFNFFQNFRWLTF